MNAAVEVLSGFSQTVWHCFYQHHASFVPIYILDLFIYHEPVHDIIHRQMCELLRRKTGTIHVCMVLWALILDGELEYVVDVPRHVCEFEVKATSNTSD